MLLPTESQPEEPQFESLRASNLGQYLRWIAEYGEGYPPAVVPERQSNEWSGLLKEEWLTGGIRSVVYVVCLVLYGTVHDSVGWRYPRGASTRT
ncbi:hypothetical protein [Dictyobacter alpinus]|uniref:hypothetical protein n=1 Tax=Dictyobacter alpinus TaxID=2014873 RepID=UPI000F818F67|nr:hypothetical protein [Dictyobacter alpinus]